MVRSLPLALVAMVMLSVASFAQTPAVGLAQLDFIIGEWRGTSKGDPGEGTVERACTKVLNDRFVECRTTTTYKKGEVHVERSFYSYDKAGKKLRLRQFHGEGFVNSYTEAGTLSFVTVEIENIPAGWRARETYERPSPDTWQERFELAAPTGEFKLYTASTLQRVKR